MENALMTAITTLLGISYRSANDTYHFITYKYRGNIPCGTAIKQIDAVFARTTLLEIKRDNENPWNIKFFEYIERSGRVNLSMDPSFIYKCIQYQNRPRCY